MTEGLTPLEIHIGTIFTDFFNSPLSYGVERIASEKGLIYVRIHDLRDYTHLKHRKVDDKPFGGGPGMVMRPEPFFNLVFDICKSRDIDSCKSEAEIILLSPRGNLFNQKIAQELALSEKKMILLCGRYEGVDERVSECLATREISIGDYILSGGEPACLVVLDAVVRLLPGVLGCSESKVEESYERGLLEYPQYTRPEDYEGMKVPPVLTSGNHRLIKNWRLRKSVENTFIRRPDLLRDASLTAEEKDIVDNLIKKYKSNKNLE